MSGVDAYAEALRETLQVDANGETTVEGTIVSAQELVGSMLTGLVHLTDGSDHEAIARARGQLALVSVHLAAAIEVLHEAQNEITDKYIPDLGLEGP